MQICYRCEEKTNGLLEKITKKNGISKNHLIDEIIKDYLYQNPYRLPDFHNVHTEKQSYLVFNTPMNNWHRS